MKIAARILTKETMEAVCRERPNIQSVVLGHENCPEYYRQSEIDASIAMAEAAGYAVKVNMPVAFEAHLDALLKEAGRLLETYPNCKLILNDWGLAYALHAKYPDKSFAMGKGCSFSYADCPWNDHIMCEEKEPYRSQIKRAHNMCTPSVMEELKGLNIDEVEMSNFAVLRHAYQTLHDHSFSVSVNYDLTVVSMMRACHCLRFFKKNHEMGNGCAQYCRKGFSLKTKKYFDMTESKAVRISPETEEMQPEMRLYANVLFMDNETCNGDFTNIDTVIVDERSKGDLLATIRTLSGSH